MLMLPNKFKYKKRAFSAPFQKLGAIRHQKGAGTIMNKYLVGNIKDIKKIYKKVIAWKNSFDFHSIDIYIVCIPTKSIM